MNIAFFGTSDKSQPILDTINKNFNLALCVTKHDNRVGRKQILKPTKVKEWAVQNDISIITINSLKNDDLARILNELKRHEIDYIIVADFSILIPKDLLREYDNKVINIHFSLLPKYRGASPVQHVILNGDKETGITYMLIDEGMDTGDILFQRKHPLNGDETTKTLYEILFDKASWHLPDVLNKYHNNELTPKPQDHTLATYCYSPSHPKSTYIYKEDAKINWDESLQKIQKMSRAFYDWPITHTTLQDIQHSKIYLTEAGFTKNKDLKTHTIKPVSPEANKSIKIFPTLLEDEILKANEIQVEGKNKTTWKDFLNGYATKI